MSEQSFLRVALGYQEIFGVAPTWDALIARLRQYSLPQVLGTIGRISGVLDALHRSHPRAQKRICDGLFGDRSKEVWAAILAWIRKERAQEGPQAMPTLFHEQQLITMAKAAFLVLDAAEIKTSDALEGLAEALLMLNNLQDSVSSSHPDADPSTAEGMKVWQLHFLTNGLFHTGETEIHTLPRAYDLYLTDKPRLVEDPAFLNLRGLVTKATGIDPETTWFVLFALMAHWRNIEPEAIGQGSWVMDPRQYFSTLDFSEAEQTAFLKLACLSIEEMQEQVRSQYTLKSLKPYHVLPFARWPLVSTGGKIMCVSIQLLKHKLTEGFSHLFLDPEKFPERADRERYLHYMGSVFEDYVARLLERSCIPPACRHHSEAEYKTSISGKSCDFLILEGDSVVLLEAKATRFPLAARTEESWDQFARAFNDIFIDGASQIDNTVREIERGKLVHVGIDPTKVRRYFPLIVTLENLPLTRPIYQKVKDDVATAGFLQGPKVAPVQAMDIGDLEFIEIGLQTGYSLVRILERKVGNVEACALSMSNYLLANQAPFVMGPVNQFLSETFERLSAKALQLFRSRKRVV